MAKYKREKLVKGSIDVWKRRKECYDRVMAGEPRDSIALDLGIPKSRVATLYCDWRRILKYGAHGERLAMLNRAGLLGNNKTSIEYGYA